MANPRKFSEKIALHNQKQAEETAAFERIMQECNVTKVMGPPQPRNVTHLQPHPQAFLRPYLSGSLPNVNQIAANPQMELYSHQAAFDESKHPMRHPSRLDSRMRPYAYAPHARRHPMPLELGRNRVPHLDGQAAPYPNTYLSPPHESNWRSFALSRTNSDSALHQSVMHPNNQEAFNTNHPIHNQIRRDANNGGFNSNSMNPSYKALLENKKFEQQLQNANRPKSCEAPNISLVPQGESTAPMATAPDGTSLPIASARPIAPTNPNYNPNLSQVAQIGNNTGSLPNLPALFNHPAPPNPPNYSDQHPSSQNIPSSNALYHQAQNTTNSPSASAMTHYGALSRNPASPNRSRRTTINGPSPLSISSPDHTRRMKFPGATSPNISGIKPELKSPPIGGPYRNPYSSQTGQQTTWPLPSDHPGSPSQSQSMSPLARTQNQTTSLHQQRIPQNADGNLRIDVSAASMINQQPPAYPRGRHGVAVSSPLTSPTSPTSLCSQLSPVTSPRTDFNAGSNVPFQDSYFRTDAIQPLQHQFEQFHMVSDNASSRSCNNAPQMFGMSAVNENSMDHSFEPGQGAPLSHSMSDLSGAPSKLAPTSNHVSKIPDIVLTGADDQQQSVKSCSGLFDFNAGSLIDSDLGNYFPNTEVKSNLDLGMEELRMLDETNVISDPAIEDALHNL